MSTVTKKAKVPFNKATEATKKLEHPINTIKSIVSNWKENGIITDYQAFNLFALATIASNKVEDVNVKVAISMGINLINSLATKYSVVKLTAVHPKFIEAISTLA